MAYFTFEPFFQSAQQAEPPTPAITSPLLLPAVVRNQFCMDSAFRDSVLVFIFAEAACFSGHAHMLFPSSLFRSAGWSSLHFLPSRGGGPDPATEQDPLQAGEEDMWFDTEVFDEDIAELRNFREGYGRKGPPIDEST